MTVYFCLVSGDTIKLVAISHEQIENVSHVQYASSFTIEPPSQKHTSSNADRIKHTLHGSRVNVPYLEEDDKEKANR